MKEYLDPAGVIWAYEEDGSQDVLIPANFKRLSTAEAAALRASRVDPKEELKKQILALEYSVTPRRMREAVLGVDNGWLLNVEMQITALRSKL